MCRLEEASTLVRPLAEYCFCSSEMTGSSVKYFATLMWPGARWSGQELSGGQKLWEVAWELCERSLLDGTLCERQPRGKGFWGDPVEDFCHCCPLSEVNSVWMSLGAGRASWISLVILVEMNFDKFCEVPFFRWQPHVPSELKHYSMLWPEFLWNWQLHFCWLMQNSQELQ